MYKPESISDEVFKMLVEEGFEEWISYDEDLLQKKGIYRFVYKATSYPLSLREVVSQEAFDEGEFQWRDLRRKIKEMLPPQIIRGLISEANALLRNANRRTMSHVIKDLEVWSKKAAEEVERMLGPKVASDLLSDVPLPSHLKAGSPQALQFIVEARVDRLSQKT